MSQSIPLTHQGRGPYCELKTALFSTSINELTQKWKNKVLLLTVQTQGWY